MTSARMMIAALATSMLASATDAARGTGEYVPHQAIAMEAPGELIVEPDKAAAIRVLSGNPADLEITTDARRGLRVRCRTAGCAQSPPRILVLTPSVTALSVKGGGTLRVNSGFAPHRTLALSVAGAGRIDTRNLDSATAVATVSGGGTIHTRASSTLVASALGGGQIIYSGSPKTVVQQGGDVRRAETLAGKQRIERN